MLKMRGWTILLIAFAIIASMCGSYLVAKERERIATVTISNNEMLKLIDSRIGSESAENIRIANELRDLLEKAIAFVSQQEKALENHEKIIQRSDKIIENQGKILQLLQSKQ